jgi:hypothetical protein
MFYYLSIVAHYLSLQILKMLGGFDDLGSNKVKRCTCMSFSLNSQLFIQSSQLLGYLLCLRLI